MASPCSPTIPKAPRGGLLAAALGLAAALAAPAAAQQTTIDVPQGSPVFPSIGQVDCLEDAASGRLCAATWECADGSSGDLWPDMGNPDGRRTTSADHDLAIKRGCVVTVDGRAAARWFSGFRPAGRAGDLLGVTTMAAAKRPVVRTASSSTSGGLLLDWLAANQQLTPAAVVGDRCDHIRTGPEFAEHDEPLADAPALWAMFVGHLNAAAARVGGCADANLRYRCCGPGLRGSLWPNDDTYPADDFRACCAAFEAEHDRLGITPPH